MGDDHPKFNKNETFWKNYHRFFSFLKNKPQVIRKKKVRKKKNTTKASQKKNSRKE